MDKKIIRVTQVDETLTQLTWVINNICNNKCSYCNSDLNSGIGHHYSWENAKKFLEQLFERYPKIHCSVSGGEPSLSPFLPELTSMFNSSGNSIGLTSNAFKPIEYWEKLSKDVYYICFSYHPEFPVKNFREKVIASSLNTFVTVRIMMLPSMWDHCVEVFNSFKDISTIYIEPVRILDWGGINREAHVYSEEQLDWFETEEAIEASSGRRSMFHLVEIKEPVKLGATYELDDKSIVSCGDANPVQFINHGMTNFQGYTCEIGLKSLFVHYDGKIQMANCQVGEFIGEIEDMNNIKWPTKPIICNKTLCHCATDVGINKWAPNYMTLGE
jgi:organic radical activating enzyme